MFWRLTWALGAWRRSRSRTTRIQSITSRGLFSVYSLLPILLLFYWPTMLAEYKLNGVFWFGYIFQWLDLALKLKFLGLTVVGNRANTCIFNIRLRWISLKRWSWTYLAYSLCGRHRKLVISLGKGPTIKKCESMVFDHTLHLKLLSFYSEFFHTFFLM